MRTPATDNLRSKSIFELSDEELRERLSPTVERKNRPRGPRRQFLEAYEMFRYDKEKVLRITLFFIMILYFFPCPRSTDKVSFRIFAVV